MQDQSKNKTEWTNRKKKYNESTILNLIKKLS